MQTTIATKQGKVEGFLSGGAVVFRGIPYAAPPVGELRFRRPQEHEPWDGVLGCKEFGCSCPQADLSGLDLYGKEFYDVPMPAHSEDCLYLNVWTPESAGPGDKLPVMFWIHGGAFMHGTGSEKEFDGEDMARRGVILVTINYRVNAFGFFAHPELEKENEEQVSGNYGILDQIAALKWVRENIAAFGGDPENITIFGQSAGCMSVQTIISSNLSKGMFKRAILQSGGGLHALHETPSREQAQESGKKLMEHLGVSTIAELRKVPAGRLGLPPICTTSPESSPAIMPEPSTRRSSGTCSIPSPAAGGPGRTGTGSLRTVWPGTGPTSPRPATPTPPASPAGSRIPARGASAYSIKERWSAAALHLIFWRGIGKALTKRYTFL